MTDDIPRIDWPSIRALVRAPATLTPAHAAARGGAATRFAAAQEDERLSEAEIAALNDARARALNRNGGPWL